MVSPVGFEPKGAEDKKTEKYLWVKKKGAQDSTMKKLKVNCGLGGDMYTEIIDFNLEDDYQVLVKVNVLDD